MKHKILDNREKSFSAEIVLFVHDDEKFLINFVGWNEPRIREKGMQRLLQVPTSLQTFYYKILIKIEIFL